MRSIPQIFQNFLAYPEFFINFWYDDFGGTMTTFIYWLIWSAVATVGSKYSLTYLLDRQFNWVNTLIIVLTFEWYLMLMSNSKKNKSNININKTTEPSVTLSEFNKLIQQKKK
jgi:hypothetical protein